MVMGFGPVKDLTHHLEAFFDRLRCGKRTLDRPVARPLLPLPRRPPRLPQGPPGQRREHGRPRRPDRRRSRISPTTRPAAPSRSREPPIRSRGAGSTACPTPRVCKAPICLTLRFEPKLPWPDMKAKLVLNRLAAKGRILATEPARRPTWRTIETLHQFRVWLQSDGDVDELLRARRRRRRGRGPKAEPVPRPGASPTPVEPVLPGSRRCRLPAPRRWGTGPEIISPPPEGAGAVELPRRRPPARRPRFGSAPPRSRSGRRSPRRSASTSTGSTS